MQNYSILIQFNWQIWNFIIFAANEIQTVRRRQRYRNAIHIQCTVPPPTEISTKKVKQQQQQKQRNIEQTHTLD